MTTTTTAVVVAIARPLAAGGVGGPRGVVLVLLDDLLGSGSVDLREHDVIKHIPRLGHMEIG